MVLFIPNKKGMKKIFVSLLFIIGNYAYSQNNDIFKEHLSTYFKTYPFEKTKDSLLKELLQDKDFIIDTLIYPDANTRFYVRGFYKNFNPFSQKMSAVVLIITETNLLATYKSKSKSKETQLIFQMIGLTDSTENGKSIAMLAEDSLHFTLNQYYPNNRKQETPKKTGYNGYYRSYYRTAYPQITTGVGKCMPSSKSYGIIIRIDSEFLVN